MDHQELLMRTDSIHSRCKQLLSKKKKHRDSSEDRLLQFKMAAALRRKSRLESVADMATKHTTQLFIMIKEHSGGEEITLKQWQETLIDEINYRYIMLAMLEEDAGK